MNITIFGHGHLAQAVGKNLAIGDNHVTYLTHEDHQPLGGLVILAVPYSAIDDIVSRYRQALSGKVVVDATNPIDFQTWQPVVPANSSSAQQLSQKLSDSKVLKAFNTATAASLTNGQLANGQPTQVLVAGDDEDAKQVLTSILKDSPLTVINVGGLARARELEALGLLELSLAFNKQLPIDGGFQIVK